MDETLEDTIQEMLDLLQELWEPKWVSTPCDCNNPKGLLHRRVAKMLVRYDRVQFVGAQLLPGEEKVDA